MHLALKELQHRKSRFTMIAIITILISWLVFIYEPTASLDTARAHEVVELSAQEVKARQKAAIMVTHDERLLSYCDKVYRIEDGIISRVEFSSFGSH